MTTNERDNLHTVFDSVLDTIDGGTNVRMSITQSYLSIFGFRTYVEISSRPDASDVKDVLDALEQLRADTKHKE